MGMLLGATVSAQGEALGALCRRRGSALPPGAGEGWDGGARTGGLRPGSAPPRWSWGVTSPSGARGARPGGEPEAARQAEGVAVVQRGPLLAELHHDQPLADGSGGVDP